MKINNSTEFHIFCTVRLTGDWTHTWDWKDRLVGSVLDDLIQDKEIRYTYDEAKQRVLKNNVTDEEVTMYIDKYFDREGAIEKSHIFANDTKVATLEIEGEESRFVYHHEDHLTGANVDTDSEGAVVQLLDYFPYGETRIDDHDEDYQNDYQFTGKERDDETGLSYYEARYYHSNIGRFLSRDTWEGDLQDPQSLNKYSYVQNNPLKYVDPDGEKVTLVAKQLEKGGLFGKLGTHYFLRIEPNDPRDFGFDAATFQKINPNFSPESFTLGAYGDGGDTF